ncbi:hypothetical protein D9757_005916 [Collybiopsis confluens]|uniref:Nuclear condensin complex subunit 3 C-terminal domain-containing protein n=1 Tax=Collybiopsis confluens TaxID=2823264 RepID=A0A8H5HNV4_9AGAR|nr:hypothetical protein D9757_005916 [Collybiopsis confluens]
MPGETTTRKRATAETNAKDLFPKVSAIFEQVQNTTANHQKNIVALHRIYIDTAQLRGRTKDGATILTGEKQFEQIVYGLLLRLLETKKGGSGDRVVKFFAAFVRTLNEKALEDPVHEDDIDEFNVAYTPAARFTERVVCKLLINGFSAKEKVARYRAVHLCSELVFSLGEIDDKVYYDLRNKLLERINDKETSIRSQAAIALCKFYGIDEPTELKERKLDSLSELLFESLAYDPQPEVRRAILCNLPINRTPITHILQRTRDVDDNVRKMVYAVLARDLSTQGEDEAGLTMGFTHPRALKIEERELIVRNGLGDREDVVRSAAANLIEKWVETANLDEPKPKEENQEANVKQELVLALLKMFDLNTDKIAAEALTSVFQSNSRYADALTFGDTYWSSLTPETTFLARVSTQFYQSKIKTVPEAKRQEFEDRLEAILPTVTSLAFRLLTNFNDLVDAIQQHEKERHHMGDEERTLKQDELDNKQFVVSELLKIAVLLDYADEIGRKKMLSLIRDILIHDYLPQDLIAPCMEILSILADSERDLIRVVAIEIVQALRDPGDDEDEVPAVIDPDSSFNENETPTPEASKTVGTIKSREEMTEVERLYADRIDKRCLCICESMLERINSTLEKNSSLDGIWSDVIKPAVLRKDGDFREQGLRCFGLISLISKNIAPGALGFLKQTIGQPSSDEVNIIVMEAVFDILTLDVWVGEFKKLLENGESSSKDLRAVLCMGLAKLALAGVLVDEKIMELLLKDYFSPKNANNQKLKQCLSFFFRMYCASSVGNQQMMFMSVYVDLCKIREEMDDDEDMASLVQIANMMLDWTHPDALYTKDWEAEGDTRVHFDIVKDIMKELLNKNSSLLKDHKKVLCQQLSKLYLPDDVDEDEVRYLNLMMDKIPSCRPLGDMVSRNAFTKFQTVYVKKYEKQLEGLTAEEYFSHEKHQAEAEFLNTDDERPSNPKKSTRGRKGKAKRPRLSTSDDDDEDEDGNVVEGDGETERSSVAASSRRSSVAVSAPTRTMPKRKATRKPALEIITISSDSDENDDDATPRDTRPRPTLTNVKQEATVQDLGDSEEEEEVSVLLAEDA